jgi:hypothetical protein
MATYRAIEAACEAVMRLLEQSWHPDLFDGASMQFSVYHTKNFASPMDAGVSLFLYRVMVNTVQRTPPGRLSPDGTPARTQLPLDLHFLITPWAKEASLEQEVLGWCMRVFEDTPVLPSGILNSRSPNVFQPDETLEIVPGQISNEELFRIWDVLPADFQVSVPYIARIVRIDSERVTKLGGPVLVREMEWGKVKTP